MCHCFQSARFNLAFNLNFNQISMIQFMNNSSSPLVSAHSQFLLIEFFHLEHQKISFYIILARLIFLRDLLISIYF